MNRPSMFKSLLLVASVAVAGIAYADPITPTYDTFGALPAATFGGSGIPNTSVAISTVVLPSGFLTPSRTVTLGLAAHGRYGNSVVTNNGAGTFYAEAGSDVLNSSYAKWNLDFYIDFNPNIGWPNTYSLKLYFDKDPAFGNTVSTSMPLYVGGAVEAQDSWNLGMSSYNFPFYSSAGFDPTAEGEYSFALVLSKGSTELERTAINVVVSAPPPANVPDSGSAALLLGTALCALGFVRRTRRQ